MAGLANVRLPNQPDFGLRGIEGEEDVIGYGTPKGTGYFGQLPMQDNSNSVATELATTFTYGDKKYMVPLINPSLTNDELNYLLKGGKPTEEIINKTGQFGFERLKQGRSTFADETDMQQQGLVNYGY